jgi:outer membrane lipoprotein carrier protein
MKNIALTVLILLLTAPSFSVARADSIDEITAKVQKAYASLKDYQAGFIQEISGGSGPKGGSGTIYIKVPDKMRWDYIEPTSKQLISDGNTMWMYLPEEKQVYVQPLDTTASAKIPLLMLTGKIDFKKEYNASLLDDQGETHRIQLKPKKSGTGFDNAILLIEKSSMRIVRFEMTDLYGNKTTVILKDPKMNQGLKDGFFKYEDKPGVEVIKPAVQQ